MTRARIERQAETVARLSRELRFELLLLQRMRARHAERHASDASSRPMKTLGDVYAAAILRRAEAEGD